MTTSAVATDLLTQSDVALLAGVRRPVVTVWRKRYVDAAKGPPFPAAVATVDGVERFDRGAVVTWLRATGRGNNERVVEEAALHSAPPVATPKGYDLATVLVALAGATGEALTGLDPDDLVSLAEETDPEDRCLWRELVAAAADAESGLLVLAPYVDALLAASFGPLDALDRLKAQADRFGLRFEPSAPPEEVRRLVLTLAGALAESARGEGAGGRCPLVDPQGTGAFLPLAQDAWPDGLALPESARATWRRVLAADVHARAWTSAEADSDAPAVIVTAIPGEAQAGVEGAWELIDAIGRGLRGRRRAIVVGPASLLVDALADAEAAEMRDYLLRHGLLRAAVRFGAAPPPTRPQPRLALWVLGMPSRVRHEAYRRTAVADLAGLDLDAVRDDLVADVLAAVEDVGTELRGERPDAHQTAESRAHVFRVAMHELTSDVRDRAALVPRLARATARGAALADAGAHSAARAAAERVRPDVAGVSLDLVQAPAASAGGAVGSVAELLRAGRLRLLPGLRLAPGLARAEAAGPPVIGPGELGAEGLWGVRRVDLLALTASHPRATLTDPGDVVFTMSPRLAARVDALGGSVVEFPARVLRVVADDDASRPQRILPRVLAADLLRAPGKEWRAAPVRLVPMDAAEALGAALQAAHDAREAALARAADLAALTDLLADGVVAGAFTTMMDSTTPGGDLARGDEEGH